MASTSPPAATPRRQAPAMLRALRHRNYRLFFIGQLISLTGTWMQHVAQGWLVLRLTDSPAMLGLVAAVSSLPILLFALPAGTLADRMSKQRLLLITQFVAMLLAATLAVLTLTGVVQVWHVLLLATLLGIVNAFDGPARQAFTVEMVGREDLLNAIALNSSIFNGARLVGPAIAGIVVAFVGEGSAFALNAASFIFVLGGMLMMRLPPYTRPRGAGQRGQLRAGLSYIAGEVRVRTLLLLAGTISLFCFVHIPLLPIFARDVFGQGAMGLGMLSASSGLGALTAALILAQLNEDAPRGRLLSFAVLLYPVFMIAFTITRSFPLALMLMACAGWAGVTTLALTNTIIQSIVPDELRGRVMSVFTLLLMGLSPMGGMLAGLIAELVGSAPLVVGTSAMIGWLLIGVNLLRAPFVREL
ncbi:MFS transporter [Candidatus Viridilinea mediisalina]|uniref:MFS transporter n=1 Tax=Candidatus Viridilinea mediisalina TaxID=2024553 RepID=A0A2A6RNN3_9CHLR|nr:MFS transporter [Candidatus Viridilinea mediisalina]PDW04657.1 MFS transporter [Candidatus Viridilinea mediisalina]